VTNTKEIEGLTNDLAAAFTPREGSKQVPARLHEAAVELDKMMTSKEPCPLDVVREFVGRFVYASDAELDILTVWIAHTYVFQAYYATPRLAVMAPMKEAGKTTVLNMIAALGKDAIVTMNASAAALYAIIDQEHPTICFDETDNMWGATGQGSRYREQLSILNNGYTQDGFVLRSRSGSAYRYPVFVCAAFAGIGKLPDTLASRSIPINMRPVPDTVDLQEYEPDLFRGEAARVAEILQSWLAERGPELDLQPDMPEGLRSRRRQIMKVMIGIGDLAGNSWSARIRQACREVVLGISRTAKVSPAEELIRIITSVTGQGIFLPTGDLIALLKLQRDHDSKISWATWLDNPIIAARQIANILKPYGIETQQKWLDGENRRGYNTSDFHMWAQARAAKEEPQIVVDEDPDEEDEAE
jgi:hypothetical protein